ncbi:MAG: hypothetical protein Q4C12_01195 [Clostridia bacterium]|nr:hypothetical protein [Clostridia bacterium]
MRDYIYLLIAVAVSSLLGVGAEALIFAAMSLVLTRSCALLWLFAPAAALISDILYVFFEPAVGLLWILFAAALLAASFRGGAELLICAAMMTLYILFDGSEKYFIPIFLAILVQINAKSYLLARKNLI